MSDANEELVKLFTAKWWRQNYGKSMGWVSSKLRLGKWKLFLKSLTVIISALGCAGLLYYQIYALETPSTHRKPIADSTPANKSTPVDSAPLVNPHDSDLNTPNSPRQYDLTKIPEEQAEIRLNYIDPGIEQRKKELEQPKTSVALWIFIILIPGIIVLVIFELRRKIKERERESDPPILNKLYTEFSNRIWELGTPRRIKRFSNKIRLQYHHLNALGLINDGNVKVFFFLLLQVEFHKDLLSIDGEKAMWKKLQQRTGQLPIGIYDLIPEDVWVNNQALRSKIYELNKGVLI